MPKEEPSGQQSNNFMVESPSCGLASALTLTFPQNRFTMKWFKKMRILCKMLCRGDLLPVFQYHGLGQLNQRILKGWVKVRKRKTSFYKLVLWMELYAPQIEMRKPKFPTRLHLEMRPLGRKLRLNEVRGAKS